MDKIQEVLNYYKEQKQILDGMEYTAAPSGEFADYNHDILCQQEVVDALEMVLRILGVEYEEEEE